MAYSKLKKSKGQKPNVKGKYIAGDHVECEAGREKNKKKIIGVKPDAC
jgi:SepF-like predicted cell division protein (DUF552 family)